MDIGTLTGKIELEDQVTETLTHLSHKISEWAGELEGAFGAIAVGAGVVVGAITAITGSIIGLGAKGSVIQGVEEAFDHLAEQIGTTGEALRSGLLEGVHGTIDDMEAMRVSTRLLSSGIKLTEEDMKLIGQTAREMGKATGTDATQGLQVLNQALLTGQTRLVRRYGIQVDVIKAETEFAKSIGVTREELNQAGKVEAARIAIFEGMREKLDRLGESELSFKERILQAEVAVEDWFDALAESVAKSPHVIAAWDAIAGALQKAFGTTSENLADALLSFFNSFSDAVAYFGPIVIEAFSDTASAMKGLFEEIKSNQDTIAIVGFLADELGDLVKWMKEVRAEIGRLIDLIKAAGSYIPEWVKELAGWAYQASRLVDLGHDLGLIWHGIGALIRGATPDIKNQTTAIDDQREALEKLMKTRGGGSGLPPDTIEGGGVPPVTDRNKFIDAGDAAKKAKELQKELNATVMDVLGNSDKINDFLDRMEEAVQKENLKDLIKDIQETGAMLDSTLQDWVDFGDAADHAHMQWKPINTLPTDLQKVGISLRGSVIGAFKGMPQLLLSSLTGGGGFKGFGQALVSQIGGGFTENLFGEQGMFKNVGKSLTDHLGKTLGGIAGSILPGIGSLVGPLAGKVIGKLGDLFGGAGRKANDLRDQLFQSAGGFDAVAKMAAEAGFSVDKLLQPNRVKTVQAAWDEFNKALEKHKQLTDTISQLLDAQAKRQQMLEDALSRYNFTAEEKGPLINQREMAKTAEQLLTDFKLLTESGVDQNAVLREMAGSMSKFVQQAIRTGTEVPDAMKEIIQKMIDQGELLDENGNAFKDLESTGLHFGKTLTEMFENVLEKLDELIDRLDRAAKGMQDLNSSTPPSHSPSSKTGGEDTIPEAAGGFGRVYGPTMFLAGEAGPEDYAFSGGGKSFGQAGGGDSATHREVVGLRGDLKNYTRALPRIVREEILLARR